MANWFRDHYDEAADAILDFLASDGLGIDGKVVADVGCGDGIIDLALAQKGRPREFAGYDVNPVDVEGLEAQALAHGVSGMPPNLRFEVSGATGRDHGFLPSSDHKNSPGW